MTNAFVDVANTFKFYQFNTKVHVVLIKAKDNNRLRIDNNRCAHNHFSWWLMLKRCFTYSCSRRLMHNALKWNAIFVHIDTQNRIENRRWNAKCHNLTISINIALRGPYVDVGVEVCIMYEDFYRIINWTTIFFGIRSSCARKQKNLFFFKTNLHVGLSDCHQINISRRKLRQFYSINEANGFDEEKKHYFAILQSEWFEFFNKWILSWLHWRSKSFYFFLHPKSRITEKLKDFFC